MAMILITGDGGEKRYGVEGDSRATMLDRCGRLSDGDGLRQQPVVPDCRSFGDEHRIPIHERIGGMNLKKKYGLEIVLLAAIIAFILGMFLDKWFAKGISD